MTIDLRTAIAAERHRVADLLESLGPDQLRTPSLCADWTVQQVAGHLVAAVELGGGTALRALALSGFRIHRANARLAVATARMPAADLAAALRRNALTDFRPPIVGFPGQLTDLQVHGQDMRRPLGLPHGLDPDAVRASLDFLTGGCAVGFTPRRRLAGLRLVSTDLDWSWGSGPELTGPAEALMMAVTGRQVALPDLDGPGVPILTDRLRPSR